PHAERLAHAVCQALRRPALDAAFGRDRFADHEAHLRAGWELAPAAHAQHRQVLPALVLDLELRDRDRAPALQIRAIESKRALLVRFDELACLRVIEQLQRNALVDAFRLAPRSALEARSVDRCIER